MRTPNIPQYRRYTETMKCKPDPTTEYQKATRLTVSSRQPRTTTYTDASEQIPKPRVPSINVSVLKFGALSSPMGSPRLDPNAKDAATIIALASSGHNLS